MIRVAIVEDKLEEQEIIKSCLDRYSLETGERFNVSVFNSAITFLAEYKENFDIVFMDIMFPDLNGMVAAKRLRKIDKCVALIFVTNILQYAVKGYEVNAYDFIVKPVIYSNFALKLRRVIDYIYENRGMIISLRLDDGFVYLNIQDIIYVEVISHYLIYHTTRGDYKIRGTLTSVEKNLEKGHFARCNHCYLVNLRYVTEVKNYSCYLGDIELLISHPKKKMFIKALNDYFGEGRGL